MEGARCTGEKEKGCRFRPATPYPTSELSVSRQRQSRRSISLWLKAMHAQVKRRLPGQRQHPSLSPHTSQPSQPPPQNPDWRTPPVRGRFNLPLRPSCHVQDIFDVLISFLRSVFGWCETIGEVFVERRARRGLVTWNEDLLKKRWWCHVYSANWFWLDVGRTS